MVNVSNRMFAQYAPFIGTGIVTLVVARLWLGGNRKFKALKANVQAELEEIKQSVAASAQARAEIKKSAAELKSQVVSQVQEQSKSALLVAEAASKNLQKQLDGVKGELTALKESSAKAVKADEARDGKAAEAIAALQAEVKSLRAAVAAVKSCSCGAPAAPAAAAPAAAAAPEGKK